MSVSACAEQHLESVVSGALTVRHSNHIHRNACTRLNRMTSAEAARRWRALAAVFAFRMLRAVYGAAGTGDYGGCCPAPALS